MLKQRVITAIILTAVFLAALFYLSLTHFTLFIGAVVLIGAWEWANLSSCAALWQRSAYVIFIALILMLTCWAIGFCTAEQQGFNLPVIKSLLIVAVVWWALALLLVQGYPSSAI